MRLFVWSEKFCEFILAIQLGSIMPANIVFKALRMPVHVTAATLIVSLSVYLYLFLSDCPCMCVEKFVNFSFETLNQF